MYTNRLKNNQNLSLYKNKFFLKFSKQENKIPIENEKFNNFSNHFQYAYQKELKKEFLLLLNSLQELSKNFLQLPNLSNLYDYKMILEKILTKIFNDAFSIQSIYGKEIDHKIVIVLNQKIENLLHFLIDQEKNQLNILKEFNQIHGIIIDFLS